jgi:integrase
MGSTEVVYKRCGCRDSASGRRLEASCPRLAEHNHGSWYFHCSVTTVWGRRERIRRGGYATRRQAAAAREEMLASSREECTAAAWTVGRWLRYWLSTRISIRPTTLRSYTEHVERHLIPHLGRVRLAQLTGRDVAGMFASLAATQNRYGRALTPATLHRIRATLRAALNAAVREGLLTDNPARRVELPTPRRPQAHVWTDQRVEAWRQRGERYAVAVWTARQLAAFLDSVNGDRMHALWWLIALRGLRRGEAAGLRWVDVDLNRRLVMIVQQRVAFGRTVAVGPPKTTASRRTIALDRTTVRILREHRRRQQSEQAAAGTAWQDSGYVFTTPVGAPLHPDYVTRRFHRLVELAALPPVRLHDLRHGAASLAHSAGADLKTVQEQLGHTSIVHTADTYTSVLLDLHFTTAEATARLVLAAAARIPGRRHRDRRQPGAPKSAAPGQPTRPEPVRPKGSRRRKHARRGRTHVPPTRHPRSKNK